MDWWLFYTKSGRLTVERKFLELTELHKIHHILKFWNFLRGVDELKGKKENPKVGGQFFFCLVFLN